MQLNLPSLQLQILSTCRRAQSYREEEEEWSIDGREQETEKLEMEAWNEKVSGPQVGSRCAGKPTGRQPTTVHQTLHEAPLNQCGFGRGPP